MIKLLPCPFCGGTAVLEKMGWPHHVFCIKCGAKTTSGKYAEEGEQEAIEKWNRRVKPDFGNAQLCSDALELLKEQGAVEPEVQIQNEIDRIYRCPKCHKAFFYMNQRYCDYCGQAVKWDG